MSSKLLFQTEVELYSTSQAFLETQEHMWQNPYSKIRKKKTFVSKCKRTALVQESKSKLHMPRQ